MKEQKSASGAEEFASAAIAALDFLAVCEFGTFSQSKRSKQLCISAATTSKFEGFWGWPSSVQEISDVEADASNIT